MRKLVIAIMLLLSVPSLLKAQTAIPENATAASQNQTINQTMSQPTIEEIKITGNTYLPEESILYRISSKPGEKVNPEKIARDIKNIFSLGYYKTIEVIEEKSGNRVILKYVLKEKPKVERVIFEGNKHISTKDLKKKIEFDEGNFTGQVLSYRKLDNLKNKIANIYHEKGYINAKVSYTISKISPKKVNVTFKIDEGNKAYVCKIIIKGNRALKTGEIKDVLLTKERCIWKLRFHPPLIKENLQKDVERIKKLYESKGYIDVKIGKPLVKKVNGCYEVIYTIISEGPRYLFGKISTKGNTLFTSRELLNSVDALKPGNPYNPQLLTEFAVKTARLYGKYGYIFETTIPETKINRKEHTVNVTFIIHEGERARIRYINIKGNFDSRDRTVRRELDIYETGIFNTEKLERSIRRLYNTGYYEAVNVKPEVVDKNLLDINIDLKERLTGMFSIGVGYSSTTKLTAMLSLRKGNLFGTGDSIFISGQFGSSVNYFDIGYNHKWWLNQPQTLGLRLYNHKNEYTTYTSHKKGFSFNIYRRIKKDWNAGIGYTLEKNTISDIDPNATSIVKEEEGTSIIGLVSSRITLDLRDNRFLPHRGFMFSLNAKVAGQALGGDSNFYEAVADISRYVYLDDFSDKYKIPIVLSAHLKAGYADTYGKTEEVPIDYRFFVGGDTTVRGFRWGEAGPVDASGDPEGANRELVMNFEIGYDISNNLRFIGFFDIGAGWWNEVNLATLRKAAGGGIRVMTPIGPIRLDIGYKLDRKPGESASEWHFGLGSYF
ncbi:outer membrane protein assembly factor BamA [Desulfurobacterium sp.]